MPLLPSKESAPAVVAAREKIAAVEAELVRFSEQLATASTELAAKQRAFPDRRRLLMLDGDKDGVAALRNELSAAEAFYKELTESVADAELRLEHARVALDRLKYGDQLRRHQKKVKAYFALVREASAAMEVQAARWRKIFTTAHELAIQWPGATRLHHGPLVTGAMLLGPDIESAWAESTYKFGAVEALGSQAPKPLWPSMPGGKPGSLTNLNPGTNRSLSDRADHAEGFLLGLLHVEPEAEAAE